VVDWLPYGYRALGALVFVVGVGLFVGNVTGAFPSFPCAGFLVMGLGSLIWKVGDV
jgi:hypothetical protein